MYIIIEGCIASGKTTIAKSLGKKYKGRILLEATEKHPFIKDFYIKPENYAFQTEMNFILIHYHQIQKAKELGWFDNVVFGDFLFDKDLIFAYINLKNPLELELFKNTFNFLKKKIPEPSLVLYLKAPTEFLFKRIKKRRREFEKDISLEYLEELNIKYHQYFEQFHEERKIILDATQIDWKLHKNISKDEVISNLLNLMENKYKLSFF